MKLAAEPQLFVTDLKVALDHYARLGFALFFSHGDPPFYAQVGRDGARLNLRHTDGPVFSPDVREAEPLSATVTTDEIEGLYREFGDAGVVFHQRLRTEPWGSRTFIVADPDGNLILFAGAATEP